MNAPSQTIVIGTQIKPSNKGLMELALIDGTGRIRLVEEIPIAKCAEDIWKEKAYPLLNSCSEYVGCRLSVQLDALKDAGYAVPSRRIYDINSSYANLCNDDAEITLEDMAASFGYAYSGDSALQQAQAILFIYNMLNTEEFSGVRSEYFHAKDHEERIMEDKRKIESKANRAVSIVFGVLAVFFAAAAIIFVFMGGIFLYVPLPVSIILAIAFGYNAIDFFNRSS
ncbi:MAG: hypothetical protein LUB61_03885 [Eggerthellaceae bacterium]|nr:hypothetical protein [Eggerthellaceae bacterium]